MPPTCLKKLDCSHSTRLNTADGYGHSASACLLLLGKTGGLRIKDETSPGENGGYGTAPIGSDGKSHSMSY